MNASTRRLGEIATFADEAPALVCCAECRKQVPLERAVKSETDAWRRYFCGLACLDPWEKRERLRGTPPRGEERASAGKNA